MGTVSEQTPALPTGQLELAHAHAIMTRVIISEVPYLSGFGGVQWTPPRKLEAPRFRSSGHPGTTFESKGD